MAGEDAVPTLHTVEELQRQAQGRGIAADLARAQLRARKGGLRGPPDALLPVPALPQDGRGEVGSTETPASVAPRSTVPPAGPSETVRRIDALLLATGARG